MSKNLPYYLTGTLHYQTEDQAVARSIECAPAIALKESDDTWSVYYLSKTPRVPGQPLYHRPAGEHILTEILEPPPLT